MRIVYQRCCGMDVHKDSVTACVLLIDEYGEWRSEKRKFRTMTRDLREMATWLASLLVEAIAMEATGVYWKPVWNILEAENKFHLLLVNAHHVKQVPGRKTDQKDSEWIADLLQHGLLKASFVPPQTIRRLRDLTRMRVKIRQMLATFANRIQKVLEDANIKLGSVASDVLGVSGRHMLHALVEGQQDPRTAGSTGAGAVAGEACRVAVGLGGSYHGSPSFPTEVLAGVCAIRREATQSVGSGDPMLTRPSGAGIGSAGGHGDRRVGSSRRGGGSSSHSPEESPTNCGRALGYDPGCG